MDLDKLVGKKVIVTRGDKSDKYNKECDDYVSWIAGNIPIGAIGTVCKVTGTFSHFCIAWDNPKFAAKEGYSYMITYDSDFIKVLE